MPRKISPTSDSEHIRQTVKIYSFFKPCSITNIFCEPIASIKLKPVKKPNRRKNTY